MRTKARVDNNHAEVTKALLAASMKPLSLAQMGKGCPDLIVGFRGINVFLEVKDGDKAPSARALTVDQVSFHDTWPGQISIVNSPEEAVLAVVEEAKKRGVL